MREWRRTALAAGNRADDEERFRPRCHGVRERRIGRVEGQILLTREEAQHRAAFLADVIADRAAQHRIARLERVENRALSDGARDVELNLAADLGESAQMIRQDDSDHGKVPGLHCRRSDAYTAYATLSRL